LENIEVHFPENHSKKIDLYDDVGVMMKYPSIKDLSLFDNVTGVDAIISCLDYIYTAEEIFLANEQTREELNEFFEGLTKKQIEKIDETFFQNMPVFKHEIEYTCAECGHKHSKTIRGLSNFFD
jgi:hypothetical protein